MDKYCQNMVKHSWKQQQKNCCRRVSMELHPVVSVILKSRMYCRVIVGSMKTWTNKFHMQWLKDKMGRSDVYVLYFFDKHCATGWWSQHGSRWNLSGHLSCLCTSVVVYLWSTAVFVRCCWSLWCYFSLGVISFPCTFYLFILIYRLQCLFVKCLSAWKKKNDLSY